MAFQNFPYTDFHDLNLDWILNKVKEAYEMAMKAAIDYSELETFVRTYFKNLDVSDEISAKLEEMIENGELSALIARIANSRVNVAAFVNGPLSDQNINEAINNALDVSPLIFIPDGTFKANITVTNKQCDIACGKTTFLLADNSLPVFTFNGCSVKWSGGTFTTDIATASRSLRGGYTSSMMLLDHCRNNTIENVQGRNSKTATIIRLVSTVNNKISHCDFSNFLVSAVWLIDACNNTSITHNTFNDSKIPTGANSYYCYFIAAGASSVTDGLVHVAPDNIEYAYNTCTNSEDCGLDIHGGTNVYIHDNTITGVSTAITAYSDGRVARPEGWIMQNVVIDNNYCIGDKYNKRHGLPFIFVTNLINQPRKRNRNYRITNNHFESAYPTTSLLNIYWADNMLLENNVFVGGNSSDYIVSCRHTDGLIIRNNQVTGGNVAAFYWFHCSGEFAQNSGNYKKQFSAPDVKYYSYMRGAEKTPDTGIPSMLAYGDSIKRNNRCYVSTSKGLTARSVYYTITPVNITVSGNYCNIDGDRTVPYIVGQEVTINNSNYTITQILDPKQFVIDNNGTLTDGSYSCEAAEAVLDDVTPSYRATFIEPTTNIDTLTTEGRYYCNGKLSGSPVEDTASFTTILIERYGKNRARQFVNDNTTTRYYTRYYEFGTFGPWVVYTGNYMPNQ